MDKIKQNGIFYCILLLAFYAVPLFMKDTGSTMAFLLAIIPAICFMTSLAYGIKNGFHVRYAVIAAGMFIPSIFLFYNETAWIYAIAYGCIAFLGNLAALPFRKK